MNAVMELEIGPGPEPGSYLVRVVQSVGGGEPSEVIRLDLADNRGEFGAFVTLNQ